MKRIIFLIIIFSTLLTGCTQYRKVQIENVALKSFQFKATSSARIVSVIEVENPTKYTIELKDMDAKLLKEGKVFASFTLVETSSVQPFSDTKVEVTIDAKVTDPLAVITTGLDFKNWTTEDFCIEGKMVLATDGKSKKTVKLKQTPLDTVLSYFKQNLK